MHVCMRKQAGVHHRLTWRTVARILARNSNKKRTVSSQQKKGENKKTSAKKSEKPLVVDVVTGRRSLVRPAIPVYSFWACHARHEGWKGDRRTVAHTRFVRTIPTPKPLLRTGKWISHAPRKM